MPSPSGKDLAATGLGLVVAPAGCGKTHLISEALLHCNRSQLILTHTHAGVKAIRDRMDRMGVPPASYRVATLDAFALRYATAFPGISNWTIREPEGAQWAQLRPAAFAACKAGAVIDVLRNSYGGVFVDEYQDCTLDQHALVAQLATFLPVRVLGDPLQAIFWSINKQGALPWKTVTDKFPLLGELDQPRRWDGKNPALGSWLLHARQVLLKGEVLDLATAPGLDMRCCDPMGPLQIGACYDLLKLGSPSVIGLRKWRPQCHKLSGNLNNAFHAFEDAQCEDLLAWARKLEATSGAARVEVAGQFAEQWLTRLPGTAVRPVVAAVIANRPCRARRPDVLRLFKALVALRDNAGFGPLVEVLDAYLAFEENPVHASREIWTGLRHASGECGPTGTALVETVLRHRERLRRHGRHPAAQSLATPLLVKGLEFDHVAILNTGDFPDAESLYVSLTRASRGMIVLGKSAKIQAAKPVA